MTFLDLTLETGLRCVLCSSCHTDLGTVILRVEPEDAPCHDNDEEEGHELQQHLSLISVNNDDMSIVARLIAGSAGSMSLVAHDVPSRNLQSFSEI